ncbi:MAG: hypothetical protein MUF54_09550, partial [Polyangiaceae bacterium]|nr:hypothetical protein [Polyangiaceae bacterium]
MVSSHAQGNLEGVPSFKVQRAVGLHETAAFTLEGIGVTLASLALLQANPLGLWVGLAATAAAVALLFSHLGHPKRVLKAFACWRRSWISRGTLSLTAFLLVGTLALALSHGGSDSWIAGPGAGPPLVKGLVLLASVVVLIYPGALLAQSTAIPFWRGTCFQGSYLLSGLTSGLGWMLYLQSVSPQPGSLSSLSALVGTQCLLLLLLLSCLAGIVGYRGSQGAAGESTRLLLQGS